LMDVLIPLFGAKDSDHYFRSINPLGLLRASISGF